MSYIDIINKNSLLLKDFKKTQDFNGKYIKVKYKKTNFIVSNYNIEKKYCSLSIIDRINHYNNIFKSTHEYRIKKLYNLQKNNMYEIFSLIKVIAEQTNSNFKFQVSSHNKLIEQLVYFLKDSQKSFVNDKIYDFLDKEKNNHASIQKLINESKLNKIQENDFHIVMNKILTEINSPQEIKFMLNVLNEIKNKSIFNNEIMHDFYKNLNKKLNICINNILAYNINDTDTNEKDLLKQTHACLVIAHEQQQTITKKIKKKLLDKTLLFFNAWVKSINFDIADLKLIRRQKFLNENFIENIIKKIINAISEDAEIINKTIDKKFDGKRQLSDSIINQIQNSVNSLEYFIQEVNKCFNNIINTMQKIADLALKIDALQQEKIKINQQIEEDIARLTYRQHKSLSKSNINEDNFYKQLNDFIDIFKKTLNHIMALSDSYEKEHHILKKHIEKYNIYSEDVANIKKYFNISNIIEYLRIDTLNKIKIIFSDSTYSLVDLINFPIIKKIPIQKKIIKLILINAVINKLDKENTALTKTSFGETSDQIYNGYKKYLEVFYNDN